MSANETLKVNKVIRRHVMREAYKMKVITRA